VSWVAGLRAEAQKEFEKKGLPTPSDEQWKYTRVKGIEKQLFNTASIEIVTNNVIVTPIKDLLAQHSELLKKYLGKIADYRERPFDALNMALMQDGYFIYIPAGTIINEPIELLFTTTDSNNNKSSYTRNIIIMEEHSYATVIERYKGDGTYFNNVVTEIRLGECSHLEHCKIQQESFESTHIASLVVQQSASSRFISHSISLGGNLVRNDIVSELIGENTECELNGLYMAAGKQHVDYHTLIDHIKPKGTSRQNYRGIVNDKGRAVFNGKIVVHPDAQKTDSQMTNKNLLLSKFGEIDTKPELQIDADVVKCSHGATVGQLSDESLFYLRSRGIDEADAKSMLTYAFAKEIIGKIKIESLRKEIENAI
jgi:Fe-S cluster assembly protein SufD